MISHKHLTEYHTTIWWISSAFMQFKRVLRLTSKILFCNRFSNVTCFLRFISRAIIKQLQLKESRVPQGTILVPTLLSLPVTVSSLDKRLGFLACIYYCCTCSSFSAVGLFLGFLVSASFRNAWNSCDQRSRSFSCGGLKPDLDIRKRTLMGCSSNMGGWSSASSED